MSPGALRTPAPKIHGVSLSLSPFTRALSCKGVMCPLEASMLPLGGY